MTLGSKKGWKSIVPLRLKGKSTPRFCLFSKVKPSSYGPGKTPVYLNVYDLTPMNGYVYWAGLGIFHSGVEGEGFVYAYFHYFYLLHYGLSMHNHHEFTPIYEGASFAHLCLVLLAICFELVVVVPGSVF